MGVTPGSLLLWSWEEHGEPGSEVLAQREDQRQRIEVTLRKTVQKPVLP